MDATKMTDHELILTFETWIGQLDYSNGVHYPLEFDANNDPIPSCSSVLTEAARRLREKSLSQ